MNGLQSNGLKMDLPSNRWTINRIGLLNFWYYDEEEFYFSDGRLLLRGSNGSGKSVTMQSFIPLLLDGNKSPERLDPFGSRARKLENYLLGEDEKEKEESTAYLYMEFCKKDTGNYLTIGMGLRAKRGRNLNFWGFSITDGRRIGKDFLLYKDTGEKIPLSRIELRNRIGSGGEVLEGQKDYMEMVNRLLFGFESIDEYDELIKLLIQIRTPKLSKDFKPTVIYEIMNNSLQPLSDDDLRPMSEAIENMDNIKDQLEVLKESKTAADRLKSEYDRYNRFVLLEKAKDFAESQDRLDAAGKELTRLAAERDTCSEKHAAYEQEQQDLKHREEIYSHKKEQLEQHDSFRAKEEIEKLEAVLKDTQDRKSAKENTLEEKKGRGRQLERELEQLKNQQEERTESVEKQLEEMDEVASGFWFDEHAFAEAEIQKDIAREYDYGPLRRELDRYRSKIGKAKKALEKEKAQSFQYDRALEDLEGARREKEDVRRELKRTENVLEETREEFIEHAYAWEKQNEWLKLPAEDMAEITRAVRAYDQSGGYDGVIRQVEQHHRDTTLLFQKNILETEAIRNQYRKEADEKREELADWESRREPEPDMAERTIANRQRLDREGISYLPFYKAVDFREEVPEDLRGKLEEAFTEMGLLNALIVPDNKKKLLLQMEDDMGDTYILPSPRPDAHNLSSLLKPVVPEHAGITEEEIDQVLESVLLDKNENLTYLNQSGEYSIGILGGKTSSGSAPKFIGSEARERYKQENIRRLREEIGGDRTSYPGGRPNHTEMAGKSGEAEC